MEHTLSSKVLGYGHNIEYELNVHCKGKVVKRIMALFNHQSWWGINILNHDSQPDFFTVLLSWPLYVRNRFSASSLDSKFFSIEYGHVTYATDTQLLFHKTCSKNIYCLIAQLLISSLPYINCFFPRISLPKLFLASGSPSQNAFHYEYFKILCFKITVLYNT